MMAIYQICHLQVFLKKKYQLHHFFLCVHYYRPLLTLVNRYALYERQPQQKRVKYESFNKENV